MPRASEKCGCGASIEVTSDYDSRLQTSLQEWREGHQHKAPANTEQQVVDGAPMVTLESDGPHGTT